MIISALEMGKLRNGEFLQFHTDVRDVVAPNATVIIAINPTYEVYTGVIAEIEALFKTATGNIITKELEELDAVRDGVFSGVKLLIAGYTFSSNAGIAAPAKLLQNHISIFGTGITKDNYQSETASLRNIGNDFEEKPELAAAVMALGLDSWMQELKIANNKFAERYIARAAEMGGIDPQVIKDIRLRANEAYYDVRDNLGAQYIVTQKADPYPKIITTINGLVDNYNNLISRRGNNDEGETPATPDTPVPPTT